MVLGLGSGSASVKRRGVLARAEKNAVNFSCEDLDSGCWLCSIQHSSGRRVHVRAIYVLGSFSLQRYLRVQRHSLLLYQFGHGCLSHSEVTVIP